VKREMTDTAASLMDMATGMVTVTATEILTVMVTDTEIATDMDTTTTALPLLPV
jgi:hypothetical protein